MFLIVIIHEFTGGFSLQEESVILSVTSLFRGRI